MSALAFELPTALEATAPPEARGWRRDGVRLMVGRRSDGSIVHAGFGDLPELLSAGDLLVSTFRPASAPPRSRRGEDGSAARVHCRHAGTAPGSERGASSSCEARTARGRPEGMPARRSSSPAAPAVELVAPYASGARLMLARISAHDGIDEYLASHGEPIRYGYVP